MGLVPLKAELEQEAHLPLFPHCEMEQRSPSLPREAWLEKPRASRTSMAQHGPRNVCGVQPLQGPVDSAEDPSASVVSPQEGDPLSCIRACCTRRPQVVGTLCFPGCPCPAMPRGCRGPLMPTPVTPLPVSGTGTEAELSGLRPHRLHSCPQGQRGSQAPECLRIRGGAVH